MGGEDYLRFERFDVGLFASAAFSGGFAVALKTFFLDLDFIRRGHLLGLLHFLCFWLHSLLAFAIFLGSHIGTHIRVIFARLQVLGLRSWQLPSRLLRCVPACNGLAHGLGRLSDGQGADRMGSEVETREGVLSGKGGFRSAFVRGWDATLKDISM